jgi:prephenate dehydrogenase
VEHADAQLYVGAGHPDPAGPDRPVLVQKATDVWSAIGSQVLKMTPENHDAAFAAVSHLPHLLAFAYFNAVLAQPAGRTSCRWPARGSATSRASPPATPASVARHPDGQPRGDLKQTQRFRHALDAWSTRCARATRKHWKT